MEDSIYLKGLTVSDAQNKIPYYHKRDNTWCITQVSHSLQYTLKLSKGFLNSKEPKKTHRPNNNNNSGVSIDYLKKLEYLSDTYGNTYLHPRTHEIIRFVSETWRTKESLRLRLKEKHYFGLPRTAYKRHIRGCSVRLEIKDGKKTFKENTLYIGKKNKRWSGVWNMSKRSAPRKYNVWGNTRYNWGDYGIRKLKEITERCEYLSRQLRRG